MADYTITHAAGGKPPKPNADFTGFDSCDVGAECVEASHAPDLGWKMPECHAKQFATMSHGQTKIVGVVQYSHQGA